MIMCISCTDFDSHPQEKKISTPEHIKLSGNDIQMCDQLPHIFLCSDQRTEISKRKQKEKCCIVHTKNVPFFP